MFYRSSLLHFDIMFVMLCVIARATSHTVSNTSKTPIHQLNNRHRADFIEYILDTGPTEQVHPLNSLDMDLTSQIEHTHEPPANHDKRQHNTCASMSDFLTNSQMKFCRKHQDVLESILPHVMLLTKRECLRITQDLRWNCSSIDLFLDRSNPLALTREASLIRSILNASMMYLVVKICTDSNHRTCGCLANYQQYSTASHSTFQSGTEPLDRLKLDRSNKTLAGSSLIDQDLSQSEFSKLESGSPLHLSKSITTRQVCSANLAFANAFVKVFVDAEDQKILTKASKLLNERRDEASSVISNRRLIESDQRDLAYLRWTKSAIILHNNHAGRQTLREALQRQCRCHGVSGTCQFQTCWDKLPDLDAVTSRLRTAYLKGAIKVDVRNLGTFEKPDLYLARDSSLKTEGFASGVATSAATIHQLITPQSVGLQQSSRLGNIERFDARDLLYLYDSPDYCEPIAVIGHHGTRQRACTLMNSVTSGTSKKSRNVDSSDLFQEGQMGVPGSCKSLCCNRGYYNKLMLDMVSCKCRFEFCCRVECESCIRQRVLHYCL